MEAVEPSRHQDEGFGEDREPPPDRAYCETCAGVATAGLLPFAAEPYRFDAVESVDLRLVPYHQWAERGPGTMRVWLPTT